MFDFGFEAVTRYQEIEYYGRIWLVEFRDYTTVLVISDPTHSPCANYVLPPVEDESDPGGKPA
jgi:hypothetical protein